MKTNLMKKIKTQTKTMTKTCRLRQRFADEKSVADLSQKQSTLRADAGCSDGETPG